MTKSFATRLVEKPVSAMAFEPTEPTEPTESIEPVRPATTGVTVQSPVLIGSALVLVLLAFVIGRVSVDNTPPVKPEPMTVVPTTGPFKTLSAPPELAELSKLSVPPPPIEQPNPVPLVEAKLTTNQVSKTLAALASATADDPTKHYQINITITPIE